MYFPSTGRNTAACYVDAFTKLAALSNLTHDKRLNWRLVLFKREGITRSIAREKWFRLFFTVTVRVRFNLDLLIIDDWGLEPLQPAHRHDLLEILDDRHTNKSTAVLSQLTTDQWYASIGDNTLADAILDRLMHNAHRINLQGPSMREVLGQLTDGEHLG